MTLVRSAIALIAGSAVTLIVAFVATYASAWLFLDVPLDGSSPIPTTPYLITSMAYSTAAAGAGAIAVVSIAQRHPMAHASTFAMIFLIPLAFGGTKAAPGYPGWHPWGITVAGIAGAVGGALTYRAWMRRTRFTATSLET